jgi:glycine cleavage system H protein
MANFPADLKYTKEHEWIKIDGKVAIVGVTDYAAEQLGDVVLVELPQPDAEITKDDAFGVIESVKSVSDIFAPISGKVREVNETLLETPGIVNEDPYGEGWIIKIDIGDSTELGELMGAKEYAAFLSEEA